MEVVTRDYWKAYETIIPKAKHMQSKAETFTVEGYNSLFRHYLARMGRNQNAIQKQENAGVINAFANA